MVGKIKIFVWVCGLFLACNSTAPESVGARATPAQSVGKDTTQLLVGAAQLDRYLPELRGKRLGLVVNHTSRIGNTHLVDSLLALDQKVVRIFAPEHGFRGTADAGARIADGRDPETGLPIRSLYGQQKEPSPEDLADLDLLLFDIQDVGARFYTYISTLHYVMRAAARAGLPVMVLDRPNPNIHFVDGPVLDTAFRSFVGMHPVPVVHGMTVAEYAQMINGESWLGEGLRASLKLIPCAGYTRSTRYELPLPPSPNLPNMRAIYLYPSLCFFEGTAFNVGRGTERQFQLYGHPDFAGGNTTYTPISRPGAKYPKLQNQECRGNDLTDLAPEAIRQRGRLDLSYLLDAYRQFPDPEAFFLDSGFFDLLAGGDQLRQQIQSGQSEAAIRASWQPDLEAFKQRRSLYLIYK